MNTQVSVIRDTHFDGIETNIRAMSWSSYWANFQTLRNTVVVGLVFLSRLGGHQTLLFWCPRHHNEWPTAYGFY